MNQENDKYKNDKYDRELYIPKGYILPDGKQLTKAYARYHEDMAKRFIEENYKTSFANDIINDPKDFMLMRVGALQVMSCGLPLILHCDQELSKNIEDAILSYLSYDWQEIIVNEQLHLHITTHPDGICIDYYKYEKENVDEDDFIGSRYFLYDDLNWSEYEA